MIHLDPKLIHFKIKIWDEEDQKHFEAAKEKGITNLVGFKVRVCILNRNLICFRLFIIAMKGTRGRCQALPCPFLF